MTASSTGRPAASRASWCSCAVRSGGWRWRTRSCAEPRPTSPRAASQMSYPLVRDLADEGIPVRLTCGVLGFSPQAYYAWLVAPISQRDLEDAYLTNALI